jgi:hypothetical protein
MPGLDGTGPRGQGPGSGWGMGPCGAGRRRGFALGMGGGAWGGRPWGFGRGICGRPRWGWGGYSPFGPGGGQAYGSPQDETQALKEEAAYLQGELEAVHRRLSELEGKVEG